MIRHRRRFLRLGVAGACIPLACSSSTSTDGIPKETPSIAGAIVTAATIVLAVER